MVHKTAMFLLAFVLVCASTGLALAQATSSPTENQASRSPAAYVYVSNYVSSTGSYRDTPSIDTNVSTQMLRMVSPSSNCFSC